FFSSRRRHTRFSRDWSSDVCSSDLPSPRGWVYHRRRLSGGQEAIEQQYETPSAGPHRVAVAVAEFRGVVAGPGVPPGGPGRSAEIGRASCRERGEIGGGGVYVQ